MLRLTQHQINALSENAAADFARRITEGWRSYEAEFPMPATSPLANEVCRKTAKEVWKTSNRAGLDVEGDFIALAFIVLRALRLSVDTAFIEDCVRYFLNQAHTDASAAETWATQQLQEIEERSYFGQ